MDEIHVHKTKKSICAHFAESPCNINIYEVCLKSNESGVIKTLLKNIKIYQSQILSK